MEAPDSFAALDEEEEEESRLCCSLESWRSWWASTTSQVLSQSSLICNHLQPIYLSLFMYFRTVYWVSISRDAHMRTTWEYPVQTAAVFVLLVATASSFLLTILPRYLRYRLLVHCLASFGVVADCLGNLSGSFRALGFYWTAGMALLCVCRVHPVVLAGATLVVIGMSFYGLWIVFRDINNPNISLLFLPWIHAVSLQHTMCFAVSVLVIYTKDFTVKVNAVLNGIVAGDEQVQMDSGLRLHVESLRSAQSRCCSCPSLQHTWRISCHPQVLASPLAGRARRPWFYCLCFLNWFLWAYIERRSLLIFPQMKKDGLPLWHVRGIGGVLLLCLIMALAKSHSLNGPLVWDFVLAASALTPMGLLELMVHQLDGPVTATGMFRATWVPVVFNACAVVSVSASTILFLAGAHPFVCVLACLPPALLNALETFDEKLFVGGRCINPLWVLLMSVMLTLGHGLDFRLRCLAIVQGLAFTSQNDLQLRTLICSKQGKRPKPPDRRPSASAEPPRLQRSSSMPDVLAPAALASSSEKLRAAGCSDASLGSSSGCLGGSSGFLEAGVGSSLCDVAVVRHGERADSAWDPAWYESEASILYPGDPPLTHTGIEEAKHAGLMLKELGNFQVVVSSPYLRCVQTALVVADQLDVVVLLDHQLGEVYGPSVFDDPRPMPPWRPWHFLEQVLAAWPTEGSSLLSRLSSSRVLGSPPHWPEAMKSARRRYAERFLTYLRRARHTRRNCVLVSHGHMLQACLSVLPASSSWQVQSVGYCGTLVARFTRPPKAMRERRDLKTKPKQGRRAVSLQPTGPDLHRRRSENDDNEEEEVGAADPSAAKNAMVQDAALLGWSVTLDKILYREAGPCKETMAQFGKILKALGPSWREIELLLGSLPSMISEDTVTELECKSAKGTHSFVTHSDTASSMSIFRTANVENNILATGGRRSTYRHVPTLERIASKESSAFSASHCSTGPHSFDSVQRVPSTASASASTTGLPSSSLDQRVPVLVVTPCSQGPASPVPESAAEPLRPEPKTLDLEGSNLALRRGASKQRPHSKEKADVERAEDQPVVYLTVTPCAQDPTSPAQADAAQSSQPGSKTLSLEGSKLAMRRGASKQRPASKEKADAEQAEDQPALLLRVATCAPGTAEPPQVGPKTLSPEGSKLAMRCGASKQRPPSKEKADVEQAEDQRMALLPANPCVQSRASPVQADAAQLPQPGPRSLNWEGSKLAMRRGKSKQRPPSKEKADVEHVEDRPVQSLTVTPGAQRPLPPMQADAAEPLQTGPMPLDPEGPKLAMHRRASKQRPPRIEEESDVEA